jgi:hypothetical protein
MMSCGRWSEEGVPTVVTHKARNGNSSFGSHTDLAKHIKVAIRTRQAFLSERKS